jgi:hypothetical protein
MQVSSMSRDCFLQVKSFFRTVNRKRRFWNHECLDLQILFLFFLHMEAFKISEVQSKSWQCEPFEATKIKDMCKVTIGLISAQTFSSFCIYGTNCKKRAKLEVLWLNYVDSLFSSEFCICEVVPYTFLHSCREHIYVIGNFTILFWLDV